MCRLLLLLLALLAMAGPARAWGEAAWVQPAAGTAPAVVLADGQALAPLWLAPGDATAVHRAVADLREDLRRVTGRVPELVHRTTPPSAPSGGADVVVIGTLGASPLIDGLAATGRIDAAALRGRWEAYLVQTVERPWPGVDRALVIAGSDRRGTVYGIYTLSEQIGVSPWHWWADVPVQQQAVLRVPLPLRVADAPVVKYRGIFLNDEAPALTGWVKQFHGGYTHPFYERVFELLLRLRGNTLWPAMWDAAFYDDDPRNGPLAEERGIVMGTSHHEPMMRAQKEWHRGGPKGPWNYASNGARLREFWAGGAQRARQYETLVTIGMRGDGDEAMEGHGDVPLLERIVADQRDILARATGRPAEQVPQVWALYKEVQDYVDRGMRVPDDVLMLYSDDNWGNLRRVPGQAERARGGGSGIYYHFDYVGGPRSYKWINTVPLPKVWEQMHLAWQHGATRMWIVNVGDLKPMEVPIEFFLRYAWNPAAWPAARLPQYLPLWAAREFGPAQADEIAALVAGYTRALGRRKPEQLSPDSFSLVHDEDAERVLAGWHDLARRAERVRAALPAGARDAYDQLVGHPVLAAANLNELYVTVARNRLHARQGRSDTNALADRARALFARDAELTRRFHEDVAGGKWNHMMSQPHIGYTSWNQPRANVMPALQSVQPAPGALLGLMVEGSAAGHTGGRAVLPLLQPELGRGRWIELYTRGDLPAGYTATASAPWLRVGDAAGTVDTGGPRRIVVTANWDQVPPGRQEARITVRGPQGFQVDVDVPVLRTAAAPAAGPSGAGVAITQGVAGAPGTATAPDAPAMPGTATALGAAAVPGAAAPGAFVEVAGVVAIEAVHTQSRQAPAGRQWLEVPGHGPTLSGLTTLPVTAPPLSPADGMRLDYAVHLHAAGEVRVHAVLAPTLRLRPGPGPGLRYAIAFDDEPPQVVDLHADESERAWAQRVTEGVAVHVTTHLLRRPGAHVLRFWALDAGVVLNRLVVDAGGLKPTFLGPVESWREPGTTR